LIDTLSQKIKQNTTPAQKISSIILPILIITIFFFPLPHEQTLFNYLSYSISPCYVCLILLLTLLSLQLFTHLSNDTINESIINPIDSFIAMLLITILTYAIMGLLYVVGSNF